MVSTVLSLLSSGVSAIISGFSAVWEAAKANPKASLGTVAGFLVWVFGAYVGHWYRGTQIPDRNRAWVEFTDTPGKLERLLGGTKPDRAKRGKAPDSSDTETKVVRVPKYITKRDTVFLPSGVGTASTQYRAPDVSIDAHLSANPYGFLLLPTPDGRPSVNVTPHRTTIRAVDPRDAAEVQLEYDHPEDLFDWGPLVDGDYTRTGKRVQAPESKIVPHHRFEAVLGAWAKYRAVRVDGGFRMVSGERHGWTAGLEWSPDLSDFGQ